MSGTGEEHDGVGDRLERIEAKLDAILERLSAGPAPRFLTVAHSGEYADVSDDTIRRMIERGDLTARRPVKGRVLIDRQELDAVILGSTTRPRNGRGSGLGAWREGQQGGQKAG